MNVLFPLPWWTERIHAEIRLLESMGRLGGAARVGALRVAAGWPVAGQVNWITGSYEAVAMPEGKRVR